MHLSLDPVRWDDVPADSAISVPGENVESAPVGIGLESPEIQLAVERTPILGCSIGRS